VIHDDTEFARVMLVCLYCVVASVFSVFFAACSDNRRNALIGVAGSVLWPLVVVGFVAFGPIFALVYALRRGK
jgi:hypothetical protein